MIFQSQNGFTYALEAFIEAPLKGFHVCEAATES